MDIKDDVGHQMTDDLLKKLEKKIQQTYKRANKEVEAKLNKYLADFARKDKEKQRLVKAGLMTTEEYNKWRIGQIMIGQRWQEMVDTLATDYVNADKIANSLTKEYTPDVYALNHNYATFQVEQASLVDTSYTLYDRATVERLIRDNPRLMPISRNIESLIREGKIKRWSIQKITAEVTQGILQGESVYKIAERLRNVTDMEYKASIRNARTAVTSSQNGGRIDAYKRAEEKGIKVKKQWLAIHDSRTRHAHRELDGQTQPMDKPFMVDGEEIRFPADPQAPAYLVYNCRCTLLPVIAGYESDTADLGLNEELGAMTYEEWVDGKKKR